MDLDITRDQVIAAIDSLLDNADATRQVDANQRLDANQRRITVHLHATDGDGTSGEWVIVTGGGDWSVERRHAKGDIAVRATAANLLQLLTCDSESRNHIVDSCEFFGERDDLVEFLARIDS